MVSASYSALSVSSSITTASKPLPAVGVIVILIADGVVTSAAMKSSIACSVAATRASASRTSRSACNKSSASVLLNFSADGVLLCCSSFSMFRNTLALFKFLKSSASALIASMMRVIASAASAAGVKLLNNGVSLCFTRISPSLSTIVYLYAEPVV